jgi:hypothetical protein
MPVGFFQHKGGFVLRKLMVLLVSGAVVFASADIVSAAPAASAKSFQTSESKKNATPLPAGRAAGIHQAQGMTGGNDWILIGGGLAASALILVLVAGGGDDAVSSTATGAN